MKKTHIIGILIIVLAMGSMLTLLGSSTTYADFTEAREKGGDVQVSGTLVRTKPMEYDPQKDPNKFSFYMADKKGKECKVTLLDCKPQDFERSQEVVAIGAMSGDQFVAHKILMKCPSKYNDGRGEWAESGKKQ